MKCLLIVILFHSTLLFSQTNTIKLDENITLTGTISNFVPEEHKIDTCDTKMNWNYICLIDGKLWFGSDQGMEFPRNQLTELELNIDGQIIDLEVSSMFNTNYENSIKAKQFKIKKYGEVYFLYGYFSDGAGGYTCHWKIVKGKSIRLKISNDEIDFHWQIED